MKLTNTHLVNRKSGMTLIELTVVILVLLALIGVLFVGVSAYKKGADKTTCIMSQRNVQQACRAYYNMYPAGGKLPDGSTSKNTALDFPDLALGELMAQAPICPSSGASFVITGADRDAASGTQFAPCPSISTYTDHVPSDITAW